MRAKQDKYRALLHHFVVILASRMKTTYMSYTHTYWHCMRVNPTRLDPIQFDSIPLGQPKQAHKICQLIFEPHVNLITIFISFSIECSSQRFSINGIDYRNERKLTKIHWSPFKGYLLYKLMIWNSHSTEWNEMTQLKMLLFFYCEAHSGNSFQWCCVRI